MDKENTYHLPDIGRLKKELPKQWDLYRNGCLDDWQEAFSNGVCFHPQIQHQMIADKDVMGLTVFVKYWDLVPAERLFMIRKGPVEMAEAYLRQRSLGKQCLDLVRNSRFTKDFIVRNADELTKDAILFCVNSRHIILK